MALTIYEKKYKTPNEIYNHLLSKKLNFIHPYQQQEAESILSKINYYRFKAYLYPYLDQSTNYYQPNTKFQYGVELYEFDSELRALCNKFILKLEVKIKSKIDNVMTQDTGDPFWYLNPAKFHKVPTHALAKLGKSVSKSRMDGVIHFKNKYQSPYADYKTFPPFWIVSELIMFGNFLDILNGIDKSKINEGIQRDHPLDKLALKFGSPKFKTLKNWLLLIKDIRNNCAHSNRTWNSNYRLPTDVEKYLNAKPTMRNKIYLGLIVIHLMTKETLISNSNFNQELKLLLNKYNHIPSLLYWMGIPLNWEKEQIWNLP